MNGVHEKGNQSVAFSVQYHTESCSGRLSDLNCSPVNNLRRQMSV